MHDALADALRLDGEAPDHGDGYTLQLVVWPRNPGPAVCEMWLPPDQLKGLLGRQTVADVLDELRDYKRQPRRGPRIGDRRVCKKDQLRKRVK